MPQTISKTAKEISESIRINSFLITFNTVTFLLFILLKTTQYLNKSLPYDSRMWFSGLPDSSTPAFETNLFWAVFLAAGFALSIGLILALFELLSGLIKYRSLDEKMGKKLLFSILLLVASFVLPLFVSTFISE